MVTTLAMPDSSAAMRHDLQRVRDAWSDCQASPRPKGHLCVPERRTHLNGDLPVEQAARIELTLNLKTAKVLGIEFPTALLVRADEVEQLAVALRPFGRLPPSAKISARPAFHLA
jgi:hypothetical protein